MLSSETWSPMGSIFFRNSLVMLYGRLATTLILGAGGGVLREGHRAGGGWGGMRAQLVVSRAGEERVWIRLEERAARL